MSPGLTSGVTRQHLFTSPYLPAFLRGKGGLFMAIEAVVAKVSELEDGQMKGVLVGDTKILLTRINGAYHAVGAVCTHYGGYLPDGVLSGTRVYCPWHQSAFNVITGNLEEPPGFDGLPRFDVRVEGENVIVVVPDEPVERRTMTMAKHDPVTDRRTFVILGAGGAGNAAAETLRQDGFKGRIVMITTDTTQPYDRPDVSKGYMKGDSPKEALPWRSLEFYREHDIEVLLGRKVVQVDTAAKSISFGNGATMAYDALLVATGGVPRKLEVHGADLPNIFTLRSMEDADRITAAAAKDKRALCVGASFIAMETAAALTKRGLKVTVVAPGAVPFERALGPEIGRMWQKIHEDNGVTFRMGRKVREFDGHGRVEAAILDNGERLETDLVVVGIGVKPATEFLTGVQLNPDGSLSVDRSLTAADGLYAAGDIARFPEWRTGEAIRIEHWRLALQHGRIAAHNMAGNRTEFAGVPFFWTDQFDTFMQYVGYAADWDEIIFQGSPDQRNFMAFYVKNNRVLAAAAINHENEMIALAELMRLNRAPAPAECRQGLDLLARLQGAAKPPLSLAAAKILA
jgi:NADPH-dependent 2,4-dienoyl-CoA reductase/sulfur reductase-like enzyme/nitrite reductase/ring-hydroxylating ferredoxin subunit